jgi:hypothetical protein
VLTVKRRLQDATRGIHVRAAGSWFPFPPPYLTAVSEREFDRLKLEWLRRVMMIKALPASHRVLAYFLTDSLNWATMDCWPSHETLAHWAGTSTKTVQRTTSLLEDKKLLAVYRRHGSSNPLRYAPIYLAETMSDKKIARTGQRCQPELDADVHESFLSIQLKSFLQNGLPKEDSNNKAGQHHLSFSLAERGRIEPEVAGLLGGIDVLYRLANIHDSIVTRLCEAHMRGELGQRQIRAAKLAAKQTQGR